MFTVRLSVALVLAMCVVSAWSYTTKYDNIDIDEILKNQRLYSKYLTCLLHTDATKCTPDGKELRAALPDALSTNCKTCSPKQKAGTEKVIRYMIQHKASDFDKLEKIYDPAGVYRKRYQAEAAKKGIKL
nr:chemosensory protein [Corythucha ciliata]